MTQEKISPIIFSGHHPSGTDFDHFTMRQSWRLIQSGAIDLARHLLSCNDQPAIKIAK